MISTHYTKQKLRSEFHNYSQERRGRLYANVPTRKQKPDPQTRQSSEQAEQEEKNKRNKQPSGVENTRTITNTRTKTKKRLRRDPHNRRVLLTSTQDRQNRSTEASPSLSSSIALRLSSGRTLHGPAPPTFPSPPDVAPPGASGVLLSAPSPATGPLLDAWLHEGPSRSLSIWERAATSTSHTSASFFCFTFGRAGMMGGRTGGAATQRVRRCCCFSVIERGRAADL